MKINQLMETSGVRFGTSGARGLVSEMNDRICYAYTIAFLQYLLQSAKSAIEKVAVAGDLRSSTPRILRAVCRAIEDCGLIPIDCGLIPTPTLVLYGISHHIPSIMVTGSHIPDDRNGIKFNSAAGEILKKDEAAIREREIVIPEELFDESGMLRPDKAPTRTISDKGAAGREYIARFVSAFPNLPLSGMRIGFYEHSAVGRDLIGKLLKTLGAKVVPLARSETFLPIDTEAVRAEDLELVKKWAAGACAEPGKACDPANPPFDVLFSTDGDSDRPLVFDENGNWLRGDLLGVICARHLEADCVATPINSNTVLERSGWFEKRRIIRTKIGSPYVVEAMQEAVAEGIERVVGYEANGGFFTATPILLDEDAPRTLSALPTRDPVIVLLATLLFSKKNEIALSDLPRYLPHRVVMSDRLIDFPAAIAHKKLHELLLGGRELLEATFSVFGELSDVDQTDGLRFSFNDADDIVHLRPSGNAPEFRCYVESDTPRRALWLLQKTKEIVSQWRS